LASGTTSRWRPRDGAAIAAVGLGLLAFVVLLAVTDGLTFFADEWNVILRPPEWSADSLFTPLNEHIYAGPVVVYKMLLGIAGLEHPWAFRAVDLLLVGTVAGLVFVWTRRRLGDFVALLVVAVLLFLGPAWEDLLWPAGISFLGAMAGGIAALLAVDRNTRRADAAACALLVVALCFSTLGLIFAVGVAVDVWLRGGRRLGRAYVVAIPAVLYLVWYAAYGHDAPSQASLENLYDIPHYVLLSAASAIASLLGLTGIDADSFGVNPQFGIPILVLGLLGAALLISRRPEVLSRQFWAVTVSALWFWALAGLNQIPGREPGASRYQLISAVFVVLIASELLRGRRLTGVWQWIVAGVAALALLSNLGALRQGEHFLRAHSEANLAGFAALDGAREAIDPQLLITYDAPGNPFGAGYPVAAYYGAVDRWGSPAASTPDPGEQPEAARQSADSLLAYSLGLHLEPTHAGKPLVISEDCSILGPAPVAGTLAIELPTGGAKLRFDGTPEVSLRRWAQDDYPVELGKAPKSPVVLRIPVDDFDQPWIAEVATPDPVDLCALD
jgi:hypothetical protein